MLLLGTWGGYGRPSKTLILAFSFNCFCLHWQHIQMFKSYRTFTIGESHDSNWSMMQPNTNSQEISFILFENRFQTTFIANFERFSTFYSSGDVFFSSFSTARSSEINDRNVIWHEVNTFTLYSFIQQHVLVYFIFGISW